MMPPFLPILLAFLSDNAGSGFNRVVLADKLGVNETTIRRATKKLLAAGSIRATPGYKNAQFYHVGPLTQPLPAPKLEAKVTPEQKPAYVGQITPPPHRSVWTPPLKGYHAKLFAAADLAMAGRA